MHISFVHIIALCGVLIYWLAHVAHAAQIHLWHREIRYLPQMEKRKGQRTGKKMKNCNFALPEGGPTFHLLVVKHLDYWGHSVEHTAHSRLVKEQTPPCLGGK